MVDPEQELFWKEVAKGVQQVETNHDRMIEIGIGAREARIVWFDKTSDVSPEHGSSSSAVLISIFERDPKQPALLVP